jgi:hypothetical protein
MKRIQIALFILFSLLLNSCKPVAGLSVGTLVAAAVVVLLVYFLSSLGQEE